MWVRAKDKFTQPKYDEGHTADGVRSLGESPNPMGQLRVPIQLSLHGLLLNGKLDIVQVHITENR